MVFDVRGPFAVPTGCLGYTTSPVGAPPTDRSNAPPPLLVSVAAIVVPGAGHFWVGRPQKALVFLCALPAMFAVGLALSGRVFPFEWSQPLVALAAFATRGMGATAVAADWLGYGSGVVTAVSYEYGNAFLIVSGLLNMLVALDAYDVAKGRKQ